MPRPTVRSIAAKLGLSNAAVSMALRGHSRISAEKRELVCKTAEEMGYIRDPNISKLMTHIRATKPLGSMTKLALLNSNDKGHFADLSPYHAELINGMQEQAHKLGYEVEKFNLREKHMTQARMSQILESRGIQGIIIAPIQTIKSLTDIKWEHFSCVTIGYSLAEPRFNRIVGNQRQAVFNSIQKLLLTGHKRIGAVWHETFDLRMTFIASSVFSWFQDQISPSMKVKFLTVSKNETNEKETYKKWIAKEKPDAVITHDHYLAEIFRSIGYQVPGDISIAVVGSTRLKKDLSGYFVSPEVIGKMSIKKLDSQLLQNDFGLPETPTTTLVDMYFEKGRTIKKGKPVKHISKILKQSTW